VIISTRNQERLQRPGATGEVKEHSKMQTVNSPENPPASDSLVSHLPLAKSETQTAELFGIPAKRRLLDDEARLTSQINAAKASGRHSDAVELAYERNLVRGELMAIFAAIERSKSEIVAKKAAQLAEKAAQKSAKLETFSPTAPAAFVRVDVLA
jgi:hypothetical protein